MFQNFNISNFNFNVKVGGHTIISKSVTLRTLLAFSHITLHERISAPPEPMAHFKCTLLKFLLVRCMKRIKKSSRGLEWRFRKFD